jgi:hypothetical protein
MNGLNLRALQRQIDEAGKLSQRAREAARALPQIEAEESLRLAEEKSVVREYHDAYECRNGGPPAKGALPATIRGERAIAVICAGGALAAVAVDSGLSAILGRSWLSVPGVGAIVLGASIAIALSFAAKGGIAKLVAVDEQPKTTRRRIWLLTLISLVVTVALAWVVLASRSPSESLVDFFLRYAGVTLGALSLSLAFFAGTLFMAASEYSWSHRMDVQFRAIKMRRGELAGFKMWAKTYLKYR